MVTVDSNGYVYIWMYNKSSFSVNINFKPSIKLKIELNYTLYLPESAERVFPFKGDKEINPRTEISQKNMEKINLFMNTLDVSGLIASSIWTIREEKLKTTQIFVPQGEVPEEFGIATFMEYIFNQNNLWIYAIEKKFQAQPSPCRIHQVKMSQDKKYLVVHLIKKHFLSVQGRENHEFVVVRIMGQRLNTFKAKLDFEANSNLSFEVSDAIPPFNIPYLYVVKGTYMNVVSLVTGQTLNRINFDSIINEYIGAVDIKKGIIFDKIISHNYKHLFFTSTRFDTVLLLKLKNSMEYSEIDSFSSFGDILSQCWDSNSKEEMNNALKKPLFNAL